MLLATLPPELLSTILTSPLLSHTDHLSSRLVNHRFHAILTPHTFRHIYTTKLTRRAFDSLVALSQSRLAYLVVEWEYSLPAQIQLKEIHEVDALLQHSSPEMAQELVRHHTAYLREVDILGTFYDVISLCTALPLFVNLLAVTVSPRLSDTDNASTATATARRAFWGVVKALNNREVPVETLTLRSLPTLDMRRVAQLECVLRPLKRLSVYTLTHNQDYDPEEEDLDSLISTLAPSLETLIVHHNPSTLARPPPFLTLGNWWPLLRVLDISSRTAVQRGALFSFLEAHKDTLRVLRLTGLMLIDVMNGLWEALFWSLEGVLMLEEATLVALRTRVEWVAVERLRRWERRVTGNKGGTSS